MAKKKFILTCVFAFGSSLLISALLLKQSTQPPVSVACGPKSLFAVCQHFGIKVDQAQIFNLVGDHADVSSFADLQSAAKHLGLTAVGMKMTVYELERGKVCGILHVEGFHFIAVVGYKANGVVVVDPASTDFPQARTLSYQMLSQTWDGRVLVIKR